MKYIFFKSVLMTLCFLELTVFSSFAMVSHPVSGEGNPDDTYMEFRPKVTISFIIARRRDCLGFGICQLTIDVTTSGKVNGCTGSLYADIVNKGYMIIEIDKNTGIQKESYSKYFGKGKFLMEEYVVLQPQLVGTHRYSL